MLILALVVFDLWLLEHQQWNMHDRGCSGSQDGVGMGREIGGTGQPLVRVVAFGVAADA